MFTETEPCNLHIAAQKIHLEKRKSSVRAGELHHALENQCCTHTLEVCMLSKVYILQTTLFCSHNICSLFSGWVTGNLGPDIKNGWALTAPASSALWTLYHVLKSGEVVPGSSGTPGERFQNTAAVGEEQSSSHLPRAPWVWLSVCRTLRCQSNIMRKKRQK